MDAGSIIYTVAGVTAARCLRHWHRLHGRSFSSAGIVVHIVSATPIVHIHASVGTAVLRTFPGTLVHVIHIFPHFCAAFSVSKER